MASHLQERPTHSRNKSSSFSFRSQKSDGSGKVKQNKPKIDLRETEAERRKQKFDTKKFANPNRAINEDQPAVRAQEATTLTPLRSIQHKDWQGNVITDPDSSNPARSRLERPLDTIRSFEAAIDGHQRRAKMTRSESADLLTTSSSRRSSMMLGSDVNIHPRSPAAIPSSSPFQQDNRRRSYHRDQFENYPRDQYPRDQYPREQYPREQYPRGPPTSYPKRGGMGPRVATAPVFSQRQQQQQPQEYYGYPQTNHAYNESYDTNADSNGTSEPWTNSTDPSSENSSIDRAHAGRNSDGDAYAGVPQYGHGSHMKAPIAEEIWSDMGGFRDDYPHQSVPNSGFDPHSESRAPPTPMKGPGPRPLPRQNMQPQQHHPARNVMPPGGSSQGPAPIAPYSQNGYTQAPRPNALRKAQATKPEKPEKTKSWLRRTFSKG